MPSINWIHLCVHTLPTLELPIDSIYDSARRAAVKIDVDSAKMADLLSQSFPRTIATAALY